MPGPRRGIGAWAWGGGAWSEVSGDKHVGRVVVVSQGVVAATSPPTEKKRQSHV